MLAQLGCYTVGGHLLRRSRDCGADLAPAVRMRKPGMTIVSSEIKPPSKATEARGDFARRLREIRVPKGFRTARSLARALGIDENRYTRYERAEVEPDLEMIRRICVALGVTPNDLLGTGSPAPAQGGRGKSATNGHARDRAIALNQPAAHAPADLDLQNAAWQVAELAAACSEAKLSGSHAGGKTSPLAAVQRTGQFYRKLMVQPFEAIADITSAPEAAGAPASDATRLRESIDRLLDVLRGGARKS